MSKVEIIDRNNQEEFIKCCYVFVVKTKKEPLIIAKAIEQGIKHFEVRRENGMIDIKAILMDKVEEFQIIN